MSEREQESIFDSNLDAQKVTRSNARRKAIMIPLQKGQQLATIVKKQIEN